MDELSNVDILIVTRDQSGVRHTYETMWDAVCFTEVATNASEEILLIAADGGTILYSRLASDPITWNDVKRFFAGIYIQD